MDYLESEDTRGVDGVYYPVWPAGAFTLEFEWEPLVYYLSDGVDSVPALLMPESYGATGEEAVYTVDGIYTFASGETRRARLYLADGQLRRVFGFTDGGVPRPPHPPQPARRARSIPRPATVSPSMTAGSIWTPRAA